MTPRVTLRQALDDPAVVLNQNRMIGSASGSPEASKFEFAGSLCICIHRKKKPFSLSGVAIFVRRQTARLPSIF